MKKIVLTGPESTGKTTLSKQLSEYCKATYVPEFAREYIEGLNRRYDFDDVVYIAKKQVQLFGNEDIARKDELVFFDTGLIITKIWFREVFKHVPGFIEEAIKTIKVDLFLLCYPDIKWVPDSVRENGGERRVYLFNEYKKELDKCKFNYFVIKGDKESRFISAKKYLSTSIRCL